MSTVYENTSFPPMEQAGLSAQHIQQGAPLQDEVERARNNFGQSGDYTGYVSALSGYLNNQHDAPSLQSLQSSDSTAKRVEELKLLDFDGQSFYKALDTYNANQGTSNHGADGNIAPEDIQAFQNDMDKQGTVANRLAADWAQSHPYEPLGQILDNMFHDSYNNHADDGGRFDRTYLLNQLNITDGDAQAIESATNPRPLDTTCGAAVNASPWNDCGQPPASGPWDNSPPAPSGSDQQAPTDHIGNLPVSPDPDNANDSIYKIQPGDTLWGITKRAEGLDENGPDPANIQRAIHNIADANSISDPNEIQAGANLKISESMLPPSGGDQPGQTDHVGNLPVSPDPDNPNDSALQDPARRHALGDYETSMGAG